MQNAAVTSAEMLTDSLHDTAVKTQVWTVLQIQPRLSASWTKKSVYAENLEFIS